MKKIILLSLLLISWQQSSSATFNIGNGDIAALITAMTTANTNNEADIINLFNNGEYIFSTVVTTITVFGTGYKETNGPVALPVILNDIDGNAVDLIINLNGSLLRSSGTQMRLFQSDSDASFQINGGTVKNFESPANNPVDGHGGAGAGVVVGQRGTFSADGVIFDNCKSNSREERAGGAISIGGSTNVTLKNCTFKNNTSGPNFNSNGGAITAFFINYLYVENCTFDSNTAPNASGAVIFIDGCSKDGDAISGSAEFVNCNFTNNTSKSNGGAMYLQGYNQDKYFIKNCQSTNNKSLEGQGGAIWNSGPSGIEFNVSGSTFENNEAKEHAGAIRTTNGTIKLTNSTFYGNKATNGGASGGAYYSYKDNGQTTFTTIENCTFANNITGGYGGAWVIMDDYGSVKNTIIANNTSEYNIGNNCYSTIANGGNNIEYPEYTTDNRNCFARADVPSSNAMPVIDPLLSPPASNGGPTRTMALQEGSPAINAGIGCTTLDQRGAIRVGNCDIGAYEYGATLSTKDIEKNESQLLVYPNPSSGEFSINFPAEYEGKEGKVELYSLDGKLILNKNLDKANGIKLTAKGMYILKTTIENKTFTNKILLH